MNDIFSFYQLISRYKIEIPIIQRDYAQGRAGSKAEDVRKSIVSKLIEAAKGEGEVFFDFVYGRIDRDVFIPFDGQQRLTTLYLFYRFLYEKAVPQTDKEESLKDELQIFSRFTYSTRQSSREFCEQLAVNPIIPENPETTISNYIQNQPWFFPDWGNDPTVMGMMTMFDEINKQFKKVESFDYEGAITKLTSGWKNPITFHFVDMGEHKMSDTTYIKMNARGKALTSFENFKASLEEYLKSKDPDLCNRFIGEGDKANSIDRNWLDRCYELANLANSSGKVLPDNLMYSLFRRYFYNLWLLKEKDNEDEKDKSISENLKQSVKEDDFVPFETYEKVFEECGDVECLIPLFDLFDKLTKLTNKQGTLNEEFLRSMIPSWEKPEITTDHVLLKDTQTNQIVYWAVCKYFEEIDKTKQNFDETKFKQWMRVVWNIAIDPSVRSIDAVVSAMKKLNDLNLDATNVYKYLSDNPYTLPKDPSSTDKRLWEESMKAKLIWQDKDLEQKFIAAEKHWLFKGRIIVLLEDLIDPQFDLGKFRERRVVVYKYFNDECKEELPTEWIRASLALDDNLKCDDEMRFEQDRFNHWNDLINETLTEGARKMLDRLSGKQPDKYGEELENICKEYCKEYKYGAKTDWKYLLIKYKDLFELWKDVGDNHMRVKKYGNKYYWFYKKNRNGRDVPLASVEGRTRQENTGTFELYDEQIVQDTIKTYKGAFLSNGWCLDFDFENDCIVFAKQSELYKVAFSKKGDVYQMGVSVKDKDDEGGNIGSTIPGELKEIAPDWNVDDVNLSENDIKTKINKLLECSQE